MSKANKANKTSTVKTQSKELRFYFRGELYRVDESGRINANGIGHFSNTWIFLGGSKHHWARTISVGLMDAFKNPASLNGCLGWDVDHGTTRLWGGRYNGRVPRIQHVEVVNVGE